MGRRLSFTGKFAASLISIIMILNSIGISVLAAGGTNVVRTDDKTGMYAEHAHITAAIGSWNDPDLEHMVFQENLEFNRQDDLLTPSNRLYIKVELDDGFYLNEEPFSGYPNRYLVGIKYSAWSGTWTAVDSEDIVADGIYSLAQPGENCDVTFDFSITAEEYSVSTSSSDTGRYTFSNFKKNDEAFDISTDTAHAMDDVISFDLTAPEGCSVDSVTVRRTDNDQVVPVSRVGDRLSFTMPASNVSINVESSTNIYYCDDPITNPAQKTYVEPNEYHIMTSDEMWLPGAEFDVVNKDTTVSGTLFVMQDTTIILCDGATLTAQRGIYIEPGVKLTIYGQEDHSGTLIVHSVGSSGNLFPFVTPMENAEKYCTSALTGPGSYEVLGGKVIITNDGSTSPAIHQDTSFEGLATGFCIDSSGVLINRGHRTPGGFDDFSNDTVDGYIYNNDVGTVVFDVCDHLASSHTLYSRSTAGTDPHTHTIDTCTYCRGGSGVVQPHSYMDDGTCACSQVHAYQVVCDDQSLNYDTTFADGDPTEWFLSGDIALVHINSPKGHIYTATFANVGNVGPGVSGSGSTANPYKFTFGPYNVRMTVTDNTAYDVDVTESYYGIVRVRNFYNEFVTDEIDRVAAPGATVSLDPVSNDGYTLRNLVVTGPEGDIPVTMNPASGYYEFVMPEGDVTVTPTFGVGHDKYNVIVPAFDHGTVIADVDSAAEGSTVTLYVSPDEGYVLESLGYGKGGTDILNFDIVNGKVVYSLVMPATDITVSASFAPISYYITYPENDNYSFNTMPATRPADELMRVEIIKDEGVVIKSVKYRYTRAGTTYTETAELADEYPGLVTFVFTMPAADVTLLVDYAFKITNGNPNVVLISSAGHEVEYADEGDVINLSSRVDDLVMLSATVTGADSSPIPLDNLSFTMPGQGVTVSVTPEDFDNVYDFNIIQPEHGTLTATDENGNEISTAKELDKIYIHLTVDDGYKLSGNIEDVLAILTYNAMTESRDFYRVSQYEAYTTFSGLYNNGSIKLDDGCIVPDTYTVTNYIPEYATLDHVGGVYPVGSTVTVDLNKHDGKMVVGLNIRRSDTFASVPYTMNDDLTQATFTMPGGNVLLFDEGTRIYYYDPFSDSIKTQVNVTLISSSSTGELVLTDSWYSTRPVDISEDTVIKIPAGKHVNLILREGITLEVASIILEDSATLTIWDQSPENKGNLICDASGAFLPGIGAAPGVTDADVIINGGNIKVTGAGNAAGIGSVALSAIDQPDISITINGGFIDATGGINAAGIGGGSAFSGGTIKINGGRVNARGGDNAAGIGGGKNSSTGFILITGGEVTAIGGRSGAGIGSGLGARVWTGDNLIRITGGDVSATGGFGGAGIGSGEKSKNSSVTDIEITGGEVYAVGAGFYDDDAIGAGAGIGSGSSSPGKVNITISGGEIYSFAGTSEDMDDLEARAQAIGHGESSSIDLTYVLGDEMKVASITEGSIENMTVDRSGDEIVDNRILIRDTAQALNILPCEHDDIVYDVHGGDNDHHSEVCPNCLHEGDTFEHEFVDGECICGAYQIAFDGNGGTGVMDALTVEPQTVGEATLIPFPECEFGGVMVFAGWKINGEGDLISDGDISVTGPVTLVAQWTDHTVSVLNPESTGSLITIDGESGETYIRNVPVNAIVEMQVEPIEGYRVSPVAYYMHGGIRSRLDYEGDGLFSFMMPDEEVSLIFNVSKTTDIILTSVGSGTIAAAGGVENGVTYEGAAVKIDFSYIDPDARLLSIEAKCGDEVLEITGIDEDYPYMPDEIAFTVPDAVDGELGVVTVSAVFTQGHSVNYPTQTTGTISGAEPRFVGGSDHLIPAGETVVFDAIPAAGYVTRSVSVLAAGSTPVVIPVKVMGNNRYSFVMPDRDVAIGVTFLGLRSIIYDANGGGGIMPSTTVQPGTKFKLPECKFNAPAGADFIGWKVGDREDLYAVGDEVIVPENGPSEYVITACWESTWNAVKRDLAGGCDIVLRNDITGLIGEIDVEGYDLGDLVVPAGKMSSIDLNGYTVSRTGPYTGASSTVYSAFAVEGVLTITDSSEEQTGKITDSDYGVRVRGLTPTFRLYGGRITGVLFDGVELNSSGGTFVMTDGARIDNNNRGVHVIIGEFLMTGGTISDNFCDSHSPDGTMLCGAGVLVGGSSMSIFEMTGGVITNNTVYSSGKVTSYAGGVYVQEPSVFRIKGEAEIYGNKMIKNNVETNSDVVLYGNNLPPVNVTGMLENENPIGIMCLAGSYAVKPAVFTSEYDLRGDETNFKSDAEGYAIGLTNDGEAVFGTPVTITFEQNDGCSGEQATEYSVVGGRYILPDTTFVAPSDDYYFRGWIDKNETEPVPYIYSVGDMVEHVTGDMTFLPLFYEKPALCATIHSATASFEDRIKMNFYVEIPELLADGAKAILTIGDEQIELNAEDCYIAADDLYRFSMDLLPRQIEDDVTLRLLTGAGSIMPIMNEDKTTDYTDTGVSLSLLTYCNSFIGTDSEMADLAQAVKDYGYAAKQHFNGGEYDISADVYQVLAEAVEAYAPTASGTLPAGVTLASNTAMFQSDNSYRVYLDFEDVDPADLTFKLDGAATELQQRADGKYYLTFTGVVSNKIQEAHTFTISDGTSTYELTVSTLSYVRSCLLYSNNATMITLAKALYLYNRAAVELFG